MLDSYWLAPGWARDEAVVIDAGAAHGIYTLASILSGVKHVYAFEPVESLANSLRNNLQLNDFQDKATVISDRLLWSHSTEKMIRFDEKEWTSGFRFEGMNTVIFRDSVAIDDLQLPKIDCMKIDVEGAELEVLYGAIKTIRRDKPKLLIEVHDNFIEEMIQFIGYFFNVSLQLATDIKQFNFQRHYLTVEFK